VIALIDGDMLCYRIGYGSETVGVKTAQNNMGSFINEIAEDLNIEKAEMFLSGKTNFRNDVAVTAPYKGNRKGEKPRHHQMLRDYLIEKYEATVSENQEADDDIATRCTELGDTSVIVSLDKDFDQVQGWHYNFVKKEKYYVTEEEGLLNFYCQFLEGDRIDNIVGVKGIGKVKARKLLEGKTEAEMFDICAEKLESEERAIENGRLLYLRREPDELWQPPSARG
jgi:hypothetical protein